METMGSSVTKDSGQNRRGNRGKGRGAAFLLSLLGTDRQDCIVWPMFRDPVNGYGRVGYLGKQEWAHRLMCQFAKEPAPTDEHEAAHSCGRGHDGCVNPNHLSWQTPSGNQRERRRHGTHSNGHGPYALTPEQADEIRALKGTMTQKQVGELYGVHWTSIGNIWRGVTYAIGKPRRRSRKIKNAA